MGILNITPDSFMDKGSCFSIPAAVKHALEMQAEGADIIDIGAMSTRPGSGYISPDEEIGRLAPVMEQLMEKLEVPVSVDTVYAQTAVYALDHGAAIINDVSGVFDEPMAKVIKEYEAGWIVTHTGGLTAGAATEYENGVTECVKAFFDEMLEKTAEYGISRPQICLDPGFGFAKNTAQNLELLSNLNKLKKEDIALLCGVSAKRFIGDITGHAEPSKRLYGTLGANIAAVYAGADIVRVHNVREHVEALKVIDRLIR